jgi:hypothetical protein
MAKVILKPTDNNPELIRSELARYLSAGEKVEVHFYAAGALGISFINIAIASLLTEFSSDTLNNRLTFYGMSQEHKRLLARAISFQKEVLARG